MQSRRALQTWPLVALPDVGLAVAKWTAAKSGAIGSLWPAAPYWLQRYLGELTNAHAHSVPGKN
jgi:hypothetical protein